MGFNSSVRLFPICFDIHSVWVWFAGGLLGHCYTCRDRGFDNTDVRGYRPSHSYQQYVPLGQKISKVSEQYARLSGQVHPKVVML